MNCYTRMSVKPACYLSCVESHFQNMPYMDINLLVLTSFEVTAVTTIIWILKNCHLLGYLTKWLQRYSYLIRLTLEAPNLTGDGTN